MSYERCKSCTKYSPMGNCCLMNGVGIPIIMDNIECQYYERNENMTQNKTKKIKKKSFNTKEVFGDVPKADDIASYSAVDDKEKSQAELLAEAMHQQAVISHADMVNHPPHYADSCSIECIEAMEITFGVEYTAVYCLINAYKYLWRRKAKNGLQDVQKALWYLDRYYSYTDMLSFVMSTNEYDMYNEKAHMMYDMATKAKGKGDCENEKQN